jgi:hypothetical protein
MVGLNTGITQLKENPYLSYLALENRTKKVDTKESQVIDGEGIDFSKEVRRLNPVVEQIAEELNYREEREDDRQEDDEHCSENLQEEDATRFIRSAWQEALGAHLLKKTA